MKKEIFATSIMSCMTGFLGEEAQTSWGILGQTRQASETYMKGVLAFTDEELVSSDFIHNVQLGQQIGRIIYCNYGNPPDGNVVYHYFSRMFNVGMAM